MSQLVRFGVAMEKELLAGFDELCTKRSYANRSEALRDLVRRELDDAAWETGAETCATITLVYDHHKPELSERLTSIQHDFGQQIISTLHVHLDHHHCLEVIAARGAARALKALADQLLASKGVLSGGIVAARVPEGTHEHSHSHR